MRVTVMQCFLFPVVFARTCFSPFLWTVVLLGKYKNTGVWLELSLITKCCCCGKQEGLPGAVLIGRSWLAGGRAQGGCAELKNVYDTAQGDCTAMLHRRGAEQKLVLIDIEEDSVPSAGLTTTKPFNCKTVLVKALPVWHVNTECSMSASVFISDDPHM